MANQTLKSSDRPLPPSQGIFVGGAASGIIAGAVMGVFAMTYMAWAGAGFFALPRGTAASLLGVTALVGGAGTITLGLFLHFVTAAFWGILFASIIRKDTPAGKAFWGGLAYGVGMWAVMIYGVVPVLDPVMQPRVAMMPGAVFIAHLVYGACLFVTPALRRRYAERPLRPRLHQVEREKAGV